MGIKHDQNKPDWDIADFDAIEDMIRVLTFGANKYERDGWREVEAERYLSALMRHIAAYKRGEILDLESGLPHLAHAACNIHFLQVFQREGLHNG